MKLLRLLIVAVVVCHSGWSPAAEKPAAKEEPALVVATFNINWGNVNLPKIAAAIREAKADLVFLQETNAQSESYLRRQFFRDYKTIVFQGGGGRMPAERFGFLSKNPILKPKYLPAKHGLFGAWIAQTELAGRKVQVVNVHLQPIVIPSRDGRSAKWLGGERLSKLSGALGAFMDMEDVHKREIEDIYQAIEADVPTILAGDLNSLSSLAAPAFLREKGFVDSFASVVQDPDSHRTWHWPLGKLEAAGRIDYIFHRRHFRTLASRNIDSEASDHLLVVSRLAWQAKP